jgi:hypothetical protein
MMLRLLFGLEFLERSTLHSASTANRTGEPYFREITGLWLFPRCRRSRVWARK